MSLTPSLTRLPATGETRLSLLTAREEQLRQDVKEITALHNGARKLLARLDVSGPAILDFLPNALRALIRARIVGPATPPLGGRYGSGATGFGRGGGGTQEPDDKDATALLNVLVMLEVLDWAADALHDARPPPATPAARRHFVHGEFLRIAANAEDLCEMLEEELETVREQYASIVAAAAASEGSQSQSGGFGATATGLLSPPIELDSPRGAFGHPLLDKGVPPLGTPRAIAIPGLAGRNSGAVLPSLMGASRQRSHSYPLSLGLLARSVIKGVNIPARRHKRVNSVDTVHSGESLRESASS